MIYLATRVPLVAPTPPRPPRHARRRPGIQPFDRYITPRRAAHHDSNDQQRPRHTLNTTTMKLNAPRVRLDAITEVQRHAAALVDPDAQPLSDADMDRMKPTPHLKTIRRALGLTQEEFAARYWKVPRTLYFTSFASTVTL